VVQNGVKGRYVRAVDDNVVVRVPPDVGDALAWVKVVELDPPARADDL
jgi:hypothetical protein